ncbi:MAG: hypothetical protein IH984_12535 [Planctomycetes bacterium]|nr:hypothetical protein [Planctomycetota bacterium]
MDSPPETPSELLHSGAHAESLIHFAAREGQLVLRWVAIGSGAAMVATMVVFWFLAIIPALAFIASICLLFVANEVEARTTRGSQSNTELLQPQASAESHDESHRDEIPPSIVVREIKTVLKIVVGSGVVALVLAAIAFGWQWFGFGTLLIFCYIILVAAPTWLALIEDEIEDETERLKHEPH